MRIISFLMISFSVAIAMEQPLQVVKLENYTLVSNDGKEVVLEGILVRELAPGLAEKFKSGFKEAAGKIIISDLDYQALKNFKALLELTQKKDAELNKFNQIIAAGVKAENISAPDREYVGEGSKEQQVLDYQAFKLMEGMSKVRAKVYEEAAELKSIIEKLPEIGDHFLALFNESSKWRVPYVLELAFALFAVEHINIKDGLKKLRGLDPRAQLFYLHEVDFSVDSIVEVYQWLIELAAIPATMVIKPNRELYDEIVVKTIEFTAQNIQSILAKYPTFKNLFEMPEFKEISQSLREELAKAANFFTTVIRPAEYGQRHRPDNVFVSDLGGNSVGLHDISEINNIYNLKDKTFKSLKWIKINKGIFVLWDSNRIIGWQGKNFNIYDINNYQRMFTPEKTVQLQTDIIKTIVPITQDQLLMVDQSDNLYKLLINQNKNYSIELILKNVHSIFLVNKNEYVSIERSENVLKVVLRKLDSSVIKQLFLPELANYNLNFARKINDTEVGMVLYPKGAGVGNVVLKYVTISIPDLNYSIVDFRYSYKQVSKFSPMNSRFILVSEYYGHNPICKLIDLSLQKVAVLPFTSAIVFDINRIVAFDPTTKNFVIQFIPEAATLMEILDKIQASAQQSQSLKRHAPAANEPIPAAAQGIRPEKREVKQPRLEKPNG